MKRLVLSLSVALLWVLVACSVESPQQTRNPVNPSKKMTQFEHCLCAMEHLLSTVGEDHWAEWIREDIKRWEDSGDVSHHLSAYGAMGSLNDVWIRTANQHRVTKEQEPWVNTLFEWLKSVCYYLARHPNKEVTADSLRKAIGRYDPSLAAFVGGDKAPESMRGMANEARTLRAARCLDCGYAEASTTSIDQFIADDIIPNMVFRACETLTLDELVDRVLALNIPELTEMRKQLSTAATASGIVLNESDDWMWTCTNCGKDNTAAYRWKLVLGTPLRFVPSDDNLPLEKETE